MPLVGVSNVDCVHLHNEGSQRGLLSLRGHLGLSHIAGRIDPRVPFYRLVSFTVKSLSVLSLSHDFPSRVLMTFSLVICFAMSCAAVGSDCASCS